MAPLRLNRVHPLRHNGVWSCEATNLNEQRVMDQLVQLHVIPRTFDRPHGHPRVKPITERVVHVPDGGTLFLACSFLKPGKNEGYFYEERIKWTKPQYVVFFRSWGMPTFTDLNLIFIEVIVTIIVIIWITTIAVTIIPIINIAIQKQDSKRELNLIGFW